MIRWSFHSTPHRSDQPRVKTLVPPHWPISDLHFVLNTGFLMTLIGAKHDYHWERAETLWKTKIKENERNANILIGILYNYLSANFIFRKGWHTVKYINIKKIGHKYLVLDNFMSANEISKNWCHYYLCQKFIHICQYSAKVQCVNNRSSFGRYSHCVMVWLWSIQCMHVIYIHL